MYMLTTCMYSCLFVNNYFRYIFVTRRRAAGAATRERLASEPSACLLALPGAGLLPSVLGSLVGWLAGRVHGVSAA